MLLIIVDNPYAYGIRKASSLNTCTYYVTRRHRSPSEVTFTKFRYFSIIKFNIMELFVVMESFYKYYVWIVLLCFGIGCNTRHSSALLKVTF